MTHMSLYISCDINLRGNLKLCQSVVLFLVYSTLYGQRYCGSIFKPADGVTLCCFDWSTGQDFVPLHTTCRLQKLAPIPKIALSVRRTESKIVVVYRVQPVVWHSLGIFSLHPQPWSWSHSQRSTEPPLCYLSLFRHKHIPVSSWESCCLTSSCAYM